MKKSIFNKTRLVALTLAAATLATPFYASAQSFSGQSFSSRSNSDAGAQIAGGLIGGSVGAILGEEIAGRGNRTEGAVLGAIIGGVAGAAIGEGVADDGKKSRRRSNRNFNNRGFNNRGFRNNRFSNRRFGNSGFNNRNFRRNGFNTQIVHHSGGFNTFGSNHRFRNDPGYGKRTSADIYHKIEKLDHRINVLKHEQKDIYAELEYSGHNKYLKDRLHYIDCEINELKDRRRHLKRKFKRSKRHYSY